ncbi:hypothetical protein RvY_15172-3 [Ramazzottius varieornatus]|uniref:Uncharacterized protein n=1 Tax=Ramazzottius varieornatus TaxID=947166 RepID=A0A1D1W249_RAMVA|nr:hypothetical protein RvY_15172-3 [Ramazzottius varieornatus]
MKTVDAAFDHVKWSFPQLWDSPCFLDISPELLDEMVAYSGWYLKEKDELTLHYTRTVYRYAFSWRKRNMVLFSCATVILHFSWAAQRQEEEESQGFSVVLCEKL